MRHTVTYSILPCVSTRPCRCWVLKLCILDQMHFISPFSSLFSESPVQKTYWDHLQKIRNYFSGKMLFLRFDKSRSFGKTQSAFGNVYSRICTWQHNKSVPVPRSHSEFNYYPKKYQYLKKLMTWYLIFIIHINNFTLNNWKSFCGKKFVALNFTRIKEEQLKYRF